MKLKNSAKRMYKIFHCSAIILVLFEIEPFISNIKYQNFNLKNRIQCFRQLIENSSNYEFELLIIFRTADPSKPLDTYVNIEYLTWPIIRYKREVLFGWVDLLVSFGGIAGLFLGFSLLSGVEIIYYFTLRTCCMLYKNRVRFVLE